MNFLKLRCSDDSGRFEKVVTVSTYTFFIACIFGRQYIDDGTGGLPIDKYFPIWTVLQILFYMGLLKVRSFKELKR